MITYVSLENWKTYRTFELKLDRGTTFLVAANGVGKTSFIDAVQWALDRGAAPSKAMMRRRTKTTSVVVEVIAGDATIRVKRSLTLGRAKTPATNIEAWIDNEVVEPDEAFHQLADTWKVDNRFSSRAAFLTDRFLDKDAEPDLRSHLTRLHALDHVQQAITALGPAIKNATELADNARKETKASEGELQHAVADELAAAAALEAAALKQRAFGPRSPLLGMSWPWVNGRAKPVPITSPGLLAGPRSSPMLNASLALYLRTLRSASTCDLPKLEPASSSPN